jgi:hypothetical protein
MKKSSARSSEGKTGLASHASRVAFTASRTITSHAKHRYHERYHGRYRYAKVLFTFDLALLAVAAVLVGTNIYLFTALPAPLSGYRLDLFAPPLRSAAPIALEARVSMEGFNVRHDVRLEWDLPPGTEILQAEPPIERNGVYLGTLTSGETLSSRIIVRVFQSDGSMPFGFRLSDAEGSVTGKTERDLSGSGLVFEPLIPVLSVARDAVIPYRLRNDTSLPIENAFLTTVAPTRIDGLDELRVYRLEPFEERIISVLPSQTSEIVLRASLNGANIVERTEPYTLLASDPAPVRLELDPSDETSFSFHAFADRAASLAVWHPGLHDDGHLRVLDIPAGEIAIHFDVDAAIRAPSWFVVPFTDHLGGNALGFSAVGAITTPFDIHASARYFAASGDQIGVGPLPARVGESTKIWIGLKLAPTTSDISDLRVRVRLAQDVHATGRSALSDGGEISEDGDDVLWRLGFAPANVQGVGAFFEVEIVPRATDRGTVPLLIESVQAEGLDDKADIQRGDTFGTVDMNLSEDEYGKNLGRVE